MNVKYYVLMVKNIDFQNANLSLNVMKRNMFSMNRMNITYGITIYNLTLVIIVYYHLL